MKKLLIALFLFPCLAHAGSITIYQDKNGNIGSVNLTTSGQVFYDSSTSAAWKQSAVSRVSWNHTIGQYPNRVLVVACGTGGAPETISSATVAGVEMTLSTSTYDSVGTLLRSYIFTYANPPVGLQGITIYTGTGVTERTLCGSVSLYGASQESPVAFSTGTIRYPSGLDQSATVTTSYPRSAIVDIAVQGGTSFLVPGAGQREQFTSDATASYWSIGISTKAASSVGAYTMSWTTSDTSHIQSAVVINPSQ